MEHPHPTGKRKGSLEVAGRPYSPRSVVFRYPTFRRQRLRPAFSGKAPLYHYFTTAYDQYALRAFSVNSIDYILKPVDEQRLAEAIAKFEQHYPNQRHPEDYIETIIDTLQHQENDTVPVS